MTRKHTIEEMQQLAHSRKGWCLSDKYVNGETNLTWKCNQGHMWDARPQHVIRGSWCKLCLFKRNADAKRNPIEKVRDFAVKKGGQLLTDKYENAHTQMKWQCKEGHVWEADANKIQQGHWCPICAQGISERVCRYIFEAIFNQDFPKRKPEWLLDKRGRRLELDGYSKELGIAFEYQGVQHYTQSKFFHRNQDFALRKQYDATKKRLCKQNGVKLIIIPYLVDYNGLGRYAITACKKQGIEIPTGAKIPDYRLLGSSYSYQIREIQKIAASKGGECLSSHYLTNRDKLRFRCMDGHMWEASPGHIKMGKWCPYCRNYYRTIQDMQRYAESHGGKCLSKIFRGNTKKLTWMCNKGHKWKATPKIITRNQWCARCVGNTKLTLADMKKLAKSRGGKCLSLNYLNVDTKIRWQCDKGHIWEAVPYNIKIGAWCPYCAHKAKLSIKEMQQIATSRGGQCLSSKYINGYTKLRWRCKLGHIFEMTPSHMKHGHQWCPTCAGKKPKSPA